ncbi:alpha/beta hydrolase [Daejeonella sp.]|uniref:alpha/beta hydrolase n=1 Tax=Daejeonella sp. TaxID=2805397 RepID=UPI0030BF34BB
MTLNTRAQKVVSDQLAQSHKITKHQVIKLWPGKVPGETDAKHPAELYSDTSRNVRRITNITDPHLTVYGPKGTSNGAGIIICPGGGYRILAINIEGEEVAAHFTSKGYTVFVLEYRVPQKREGALQDVQRAIRIVRNRAAEWKLNSDKIGLLGFSAGGHLSVMAATNFTKQTYDHVDQTDGISPRPDFAVLIYPAYTANGANKQELNPQITVTKDIPPMFIFFTADDQNDLPLPLANALREQKLPFEFHIYPNGGHGYGLRSGNIAAMAWPGLAEKWLTNTLRIK